jgi:hypothetical protein
MKLFACHLSPRLPLFHQRFIRVPYENDARRRNIRLCPCGSIYEMPTYFKKGMMFKETSENVLSKKNKNFRDILIYTLNEVISGNCVTNTKNCKPSPMYTPLVFYCPLSSDIIWKGVFDTATLKVTNSVIWTTLSLPSVDMLMESDWRFMKPSLDNTVHLCM